MGETDPWKYPLFLGILLLIAIALPVFAHNDKVTNTWLCSVLDSDKNSVGTNENQMVVSDTGNSNQKLSCQGQLPEATVHPSEAVTWDHENTGFLCRVQSVSTDRWDEIITPDGKVTLSCHFNPSALSNPESVSLMQITPF